MKANLLTLAAEIALLVLLALHPPHVAWTTTRYIGAVIAAICFPLFVLARWQLGASFSVSAKARKLVTTGLYSRIRNPIYLFGGLLVVGVSMFSEWWAPLLVIAVLVPMQMLRARKEEQVLTSAFGEEYLRYRQSTWF